MGLTKMKITKYYWFGLGILTLIIIFMLSQDFTALQYFTITIGMVGYGAMFAFDARLSDNYRKKKDSQ